MRPLHIILPASMILMAACASRQSAPPASTKNLRTDIDALISQHQVQGLAIAVIDGGRVTRVETWGWRNAERREPLAATTVMYGASLTKTAFAYMLLQLVDEGRINLDASIATILPKPLPVYEDYTDLAGDERWRALTPRILLMHASGFGNFRWLELDRKLRFHFTPGTRYAYSGEGFYILQLLLEEGLKLDVGREMQTRVFDRFGMTRTSMSWRADFRPDLADGYGTDGKMEPHDERSSVSAAGSMDTSIDDQAKLWAGIVRGVGLSAASRAALVAPGLPITSAHQFPTLLAPDDPRNRDVNLAAGLGLVTYTDRRGPAWFKGGHNDWTGNMVVCHDVGQRCIVMLANDVRAERIYPAIMKLVWGETDMPWRWEYSWYHAEPQRN